ncbi:MAG: glycosyltransferase family 39 protein [Paraglaciecola sp.]|nr:glycosyltransferase family 39 protein [Paraglaciecola sp.]
MRSINNSAAIILARKGGCLDQVNDKLKAMLFFAFALFAIRLSYGPFSGLALFYDEAYYHFWSTELDWGYYSKPPLVAWLIYGTTHLFHSQAEWAVRLASPVLYFASAYLIFASTRFLYNRLTGLYAAAIFYTTPLVSFNSLFITTDAPLLFCWSLAIYCYLHAAKSNSWWAWLGLGLAVGLGLLAKYTMLVWLVGFIILTIWQKPPLRRVISGKALVAVILCGAIIFPNLLWNWQHDFISFQHTAEISKLDQILFHPSQLLEFIAGQFLVFGPLSFYLLMLLFWRPLLTNKAEKLLLCLSLPLLFVMAVQAILAKANMNWAAPAYVAASIMLARALVLGYKYKLLHIILVSNLTMGGIFYLYPQIQQLLNIEPTAKNTPFHRVEGWKPLFQSIPHYVEDAEHRVWLSDSRKLLSYLHYYLPQPYGQNLNVVSFNPDGKVEHQFDLHHTLNLSVGKDQSKQKSAESDFIYLSEQPVELSGCFAVVHLTAHIKQTVYPSLQRELYLYHVVGFQGYAHCKD